MSSTERNEPKTQRTLDSGGGYYETLGPPQRHSSQRCPPGTECPRRGDAIAGHGILFWWGSAQSKAEFK